MPRQWGTSTEADTEGHPDPRINSLSSTPFLHGHPHLTGRTEGGGLQGGDPGCLDRAGPHGAGWRWNGRDGQRGCVLRPGDSGVPSSWGGGDSELPRVKVNLPVLAEFSRPSHAVWSEDREPRTRVPGGDGWELGTRVGELGIRNVTTTTTLCALALGLGDSHPRSRVEKVPTRKGT